MKHLWMCWQPSAASSVNMHCFEHFMPLTYSYISDKALISTWPAHSFGFWSRNRWWSKGPSKNWYKYNKMLEGIRNYPTFRFTATQISYNIWIHWLMVKKDKTKFIVHWTLLADRTKRQQKIERLHTASNFSLFCRIKSMQSLRTWRCLAWQWYT